MPNFVVELNAIPFADVDAALGKVQHALSVSADLSATGLDASALLGDLGALVKTVQNLELEPGAAADLGRAVLAALADLVRFPEVAGIERIVDEVRALALGFDEALRVLVGTGDGTTLADRLFIEFGGVSLDDLVDDLTTRVTDLLAVELPEDLRSPIDALARLGSGVPSAADLAGILATLVAGIDLPALQRVAAAAGAIDISLRAGDVGVLDLAVAEVDARIDVAYSFISFPGVLDVDGLVGALDGVGTALDVLAGGPVPTFVEGLTADLRAAANVLADVDLTAHLDAVLALVPRRRDDLMFDLILEPFRALAAVLEAMTPDQITAAFAEVANDLTGSGPAAELGDLFSDIDGGIAFVADELHGLLVKSVRDPVLEALIGVQDAILGFEGFTFLDDMFAPVEKLAAAIREFDAADVTAAVEPVVTTLQDTFADFPIAELATAVDATILPLGAVIDQLAPAVTAVTEQLEQLVGQLGQIDFKVAGAATLELLAGIRQQVHEAVTDSDVPEPVKMAIAGAAAVLREMDLAAELTSPFEAAVLRIDASALVQPLEEVFGAARTALEKATPAQLIATLDPSFDELVSKLDALSLDPLVAQLSGVFAALVAKLEALDPRRLVEPLEAEFQKLVATLRAALDPAPVFAPLHEAFATFRGLFDKLDIAELINEVLGALAGVPQRLTGGVGAALQAKAGGGAVPEVPDAAFKFGDLVRPLAALVAELRSRLDQLAAGALGAALAQLAGVVRTVRGLVDESAGLAVRVAGAVDERVRLVDPTSGVGPLAELRARVMSLQATVAAVEVDAAARARLDTAGGSVAFDAKVTVEASASAGVAEQQARLDAGTHAPGLAVAAASVARAIDELVPAPLLDASLDVAAGVDAFLDALFAVIDPMPIVLELDALGDRISARLAAFTNELSAGLAAFVDRIFTALQPFMPGAVVARLQAGVDAIVAELDLIDPAVIEAEVRKVIEAALSLLTVHSPAALAERLAVVFDAAMAEIAQFDPAAVFSNLDPFAAVKTTLAGLRPSIVLAPLVERTSALTAALDSVLDVDLGFVGELVADIRVGFDDVLAAVEQEWNTLLDELGTLSGSVTISGSIG